MHQPAAGVLGSPRMLLNVTLEELGYIVQGLAMLPVAAELHRRLAAHHLCQSDCVPVPPEHRRVWWRSFKDGDERAVEWYDEAMCERIDRAVERAMRRPRQTNERPRRCQEQKRRRPSSCHRI